MIRFDRLYEQYLKEHLKADSQKMTEEQIEELETQMYADWLCAPSEALGGKCPQEYFMQEDAGDLIGYLMEYAQQDSKVPEPLLDAIAKKREACIPILMEGLCSGLQAKKTLQIIETLKELQAEEALEAYMELVCDPMADEDCAEAATQALCEMGEAGATLALQRLRFEEDEIVEDRLADIVTCVPALAGAYEEIVALFYSRDDARPFYAKCLAKIGDARAIEALEGYMKNPQTGYFEYMALKEAAEELGALVEIDREFSGDRDYESLKEFEGDQ